MAHLCMLLVPILVFGVPDASQAALRVLACEPEWGALVQELGGEVVRVDVATTPRQDPHRIEARPSLIGKARRADLVVCSGAELEIGWLPLLLQQSGNARIQLGTPGYFLAADFVQRLEVPSRADRSQGDVHASGNPHIQNDPRNISVVADALAARLAELDPGSAEHYRARHADFARRWAEAMQRWTAHAASLEGTPIVVHHRSWVYLESWLGLYEVAALEPKPGVPPTSGHLARVLAQLQTQPARMVIRATYEDPRPSEWLSERASVPAVVLPFTVGGTDGTDDLFSFFDETLRLLLEASR